MDTDRHLFGGDVCSAAENSQGVRIPNTYGVVYRHKNASITETDLLTEGGSPVTRVHSDDRGMVEPFYGPPGVSTMWMDFNAGRYQIFAVDMDTRIANHLTDGPDEDPHGTLRTARAEMESYVSKIGSNDIDAVGTSAEWIRVASDDTDANVATLRNREGIARWALKKDGRMDIQPAYRPETAKQYAIRAVTKADAVAYAVSNADASGASNTFTVKGDGSANFSGDVTLNKPIIAPNVGSARVYSGPEEPRNPKTGDVWIAYQVDGTPDKGAV
ncbi:hypothetical protein ACFY1P_08120 [Streptomyces sp. NPDC001407]|uniref:hypothetical protein n=1 Tax=Streptomyces sp. NPDC001407 TaxID=3364573 RepID=UPI003685B2DD